MERTSKSNKSGLTFPVARIKTMLRIHNHAHRIAESGAVFMTAVLEYICAEILELSLNAARSVSNSNRIQPHHINIALRSDPEFVCLFPTLVIPRSTFLSTNHSVGPPTHRSVGGPSRIAGPSSVLKGSPAVQLSDGRVKKKVVAKDSKGKKTGSKRKMDK